MFSVVRKAEHNVTLTPVLCFAVVGEWGVGGVGGKLPKQPTSKTAPHIREFKPIVAAKTLW